MLIFCGWKRFKERINLLQVPAGQPPLIFYCCLSSKPVLNVTIATFQEEIYENIMELRNLELDGLDSDGGDSNFDLECLPKAFRDCYNGQTEDEISFATYVRRTIDTTSDHITKIMAYMVSPDFASSDELVKYGLEKNIEAAILAVLKKGEFSPKHASMYHNSGTIVSLNKKINRLFPATNHLLEYRGQGRALMYLGQMLSSGYFNVNKDLARLIPLMGSMGCLTLLERMDPIHQKYQLISLLDLSKIIPAHLSHLLRADLESAENTSHLLELIGIIYERQEYTSIAEELMFGIGKEMRWALYDFAVDNKRHCLIFKIAKAMFTLNENY
jgi:hypothetical protein